MTTHAISTTSRPMTTRSLVLSWACRIVAAIILLQTLFFKFTAAPESVYIFTKLGTFIHNYIPFASINTVEVSGRLGSGIIELIAAVLLLIPRSVWAGAVLAMAATGGAIVSHVTFLGIEVQGDRGLLFSLAIVVFVTSAVALILLRRQIPFSERSSDVTRSLNAAVRDVLRQGSVFLARLSDETYARPLEDQEEGKPSASLGAHYRHVLDHFLCLAEGLRTGQVNYDQRRRNPQLGNSVACARLVTEGLIDELGGLSHETLQRECAVTYSVAYGESEHDAVRSNLAREVMFCVGHAIHHYAILKLLCAGVGVKLPYEFGIAPSTLKHLESETAERA